MPSWSWSRGQRGDDAGSPPRVSDWNVRFSDTEPPGCPSTEGGTGRRVGKGPAPTPSAVRPGESCLTSLCPFPDLLPEERAGGQAPTGCVRAREGARGALGAAPALSQHFLRRSLHEGLLGSRGPQMECMLLWKPSRGLQRLQGQRLTRELLPRAVTVLRSPPRVPSPGSFASRAWSLAEARGGSLQGRAQGDP